MEQNKVPKAKPKDELPLTSLAVLGLLTFGEMSGYDLSKLAERSIAHFFSPARSHIYSELRRLVAGGYAAEREVRQRQRPDKRMYRVTAKGERTLRAWLASPDLEEESFRSPFMLRVFFGNLMEPETLRARVKDYRAQAQVATDELRAIEKDIKDVPQAFFPYLTLRAGLGYLRACTRWSDDVLAALGGKRHR